MQGLGNQAVWLAASDEYCMQGQTLIFGAGFGGDLAYASPSLLPFLSTTPAKREWPARSSLCESLLQAVVVVEVVEVVEMVEVVVVVVEIAVTTRNRTQALLTTWLNT